jgi:regulator of RNase E activity RraB
MGQSAVVKVAEDADSLLPDPECGWINTVRASVLDIEGATEAMLDEAHERLDEWLDGRDACVKVGEVSGTGYWEAFVYCDDDYAQQLFDAVDGACEVEADARPDPQAAVYFEFLAPSGIEELWVKNRRQLSRIRPDVPQDERRARLEHQFSFPSKDDRSRFADEMVREGFELEYPPEDPEEDADEDFVLTLLRTEDLTVEHMDQLTHDLFKAAARNAGRYHGWDYR